MCCFIYSTVVVFDRYNLYDTCWGENNLMMGTAEGVHALLTTNLNNRTYGRSLPIQFRSAAVSSL